ncbi:MAG: hypothetical protein VW683_13800 [Betaproteobacteria bacterium]
MKINPKNQCPLNNFEPCKGLDCAWFTEVHGTHPQTGELLEDWRCAIVWMPFLMIENSQQQRQTGAAVESFRNEVAQRNEQLEQQRQEKLSVTQEPVRVVEVIPTKEEP